MPQGCQILAKKARKVIENLSNADVLVTGGLGFIGSALARRLVGLGAKVTLVDSVIPEHGRDLFNIQDIRDQLIVDLNDVRDAGAMATKLKGRDFLFSPSGRTSHLDSITHPFSRMLTSG